MLNPDNATLEWCAKWIEDSLRAETDERTIEFGKNMAMTIRAVKTNAASVVSDGDDEGEPQYVEIDGERRRVIPCPDGRDDCEVLHTAPVEEEK